MRIEELDTPALIVDLDGLEDNLDRYQSYFDQHEIGLRPHIKTHKCVAIAHMQMRRGAIGITCQKLGEAEIMAAGGIDGDILIPFNIIGRQKLERLTALARRTRLTVAADSRYTIDGLSTAAVARDVEVGVVIELDQGRTGVPDAETAVELGSQDPEDYFNLGTVHMNDRRQPEAIAMFTKATEMNPKLLLTYTCEGMVLPSGARVFRLGERSDNYPLIVGPAPQSCPIVGPDCSLNRNSQPR